MAGAKKFSRSEQTGQFGFLSREILRLANRGLLRREFLNDVSRTFIRFSGADAVEIRLFESDFYLSGIATGLHRKDFLYQTIPAVPDSAESWTRLVDNPDPADCDPLCAALLADAVDRSGASFTPGGSLIVRRIDKPLRLLEKSRGRKKTVPVSLGGKYRSMVLVPFDIGTGDAGLLVFKSIRESFFTRPEVEFYESVAHVLGGAIVHRRTYLALRERVKELGCLYDIANMVGQPDVSLPAILKLTANRLCEACLYPESASAAIHVDGDAYLSDGCRMGRQRLKVEIVISGIPRGRIELSYVHERPVRHEGPFVKEERRLLDAVAEELALIIERREARKEQEALQEQLRHADRLATIGQMTAGLAHELNEPLGNILGFAQLAKRGPGIPDQVKQDVDKIERASLHAREVVKKMMLFGRQAPPQKSQVNVNRIVSEGLYFLESRCAKAGIKLIKVLAVGLPEITADPGQLYQVIVNLVVNAIQAMPDGGTITIETVYRDDEIILSVRDTGTGMSEEVRQKIFIPFFTTKDVDEGTGLGLAVVHGIVTSHSGTITVESEVKKGSRFEVHLPVGDATAIPEKETVDDGGK